MPTPQANDGFVETKELPRGRKARKVPAIVLEKLADSAARGVAFTREAAPEVIDSLRRDLGAASVRAKYVVTVGRENVSDTVHKLTFSAKAKETTETPSS